MLGLTKNPAIGDALTALGLGLTSYGSGNPNWGQNAILGLQNVRQNRMENQRFQQQEQRQQQLFEFQKRKYEQELAAEQAKRDALQGILGAPSPVSGGLSPGQMGADQRPAQPGMLNLPPDQMGFINALGRADPSAAFNILGEQLFKENEPVKWETVKVREGDQDVTYRVNPYTGEREKLGAGAAFASPQPQQPPADIQEYLFAKGQGFQGTYLDFVNAQKGNGITIGPDGTIQIGGSAKLTEDQSKAVQFASRMEASSSIIDEFENQGTDFWARRAQDMPLGTGNYLQSPEYQKYSQAKEDFVRAVLRKESGALIAEEEMIGADKQYFPQPGDSQDVIAQKKQNRRVALEAMKAVAGQGNAMIPGILDRAATSSAPSGGVVDPSTLSDEDLLKALQ